MSMTWFCVDGMAEDAPIRRCLDRTVCDTEIDPETETQQSFVDECDINQIVARFQQTGIFTHLSKYEGDYGEFTDVTDYQTAMNVVTMANEMFLELPSSVRERFLNDPARFLSFVDDPANQDEMVKMGLSRIRDKSDTDRIVDALRSRDGDQSTLARSPDSEVGVKGASPSDSAG